MKKSQAQSDEQVEERVRNKIIKLEKQSKKLKALITTIDSKIDKNERSIFDIKSYVERNATDKLERNINEIKSYLEKVSMTSSDAVKFEAQMRSTNPNFNKTSGGRESFNNK